MAVGRTHPEKTVITAQGPDKIENVNNASDIL